MKTWQPAKLRSSGLQGKHPLLLGDTSRTAVSLERCDHAF